MNQFQEFFQILKHPIVKHFYCPNHKCKVYQGHSTPSNGDKCETCLTALDQSTYFIEIPIVEQLKTILSNMF